MDGAAVAAQKMVGVGREFSHSTAFRGEALNFSRLS
jgi:hypothetical protein